VRRVVDIVKSSNVTVFGIQRIIIDTTIYYSVSGMSKQVEATIAVTINTYMDMTAFKNKITFVRTRCTEVDKYTRFYRRNSTAEEFTVSNCNVFNFLNKDAMVNVSTRSEGYPTPIDDSELVEMAIANEVEKMEAGDGATVSRKEA